MHLLNEKKYPVYLFKTETSGEKLYEEFYTDDESYDLDRFSALGVIQKKAAYSKTEFNDIIKELEILLESSALTKVDIVVWLNKHIPEFEHIETGIGLDKKM